MLMVDSSVWVDYFNGQSNWQTELLFARLGREPVAAGDLMLVEVLQGFRSQRHFKLAQDLLLSLHIVTMLNTAIALQSARNCRVLRRRGVTVRNTVDCIIATWCIEHGMPLLHSDRDFGPFEEFLGLRSADRG